MLSVPRDGKCPINTKQCGLLDTMSNKMCVGKDKECPINMMVHSAKAPEYNYTFSNISLDDGSFIFFTKDAVDSPIVFEFKISDNDPCISPHEYSSNYTPYPLDYYEYYGCRTELNGTKFNRNYKYVDTMNKYKLYDKNGIIDKIKDLFNFPLYQLLHQQSSLYVRTFNGYDKNCLESNDINISEYSLYDSRVSNTRTICVVYMVLSFLMVIYSFIEVIFINWEAGNKTFSSLTPMQYYMMSSAGFSGAFFALSMVMNHIFISMRLDNNCTDYLHRRYLTIRKAKKM